MSRAIFVVLSLVLLVIFICTFAYIVSLVWEHIKALNRYIHNKRRDHKKGREVTWCIYCGMKMPKGHRGQFCNDMCKAKYYRDVRDSLRELQNAQDSDSRQSDN